MKHTIQRLLGYVGRYKYPAFFTIFCMIGEVVFEVLIPKYMALLIDNGISLATARIRQTPARSNSGRCAAEKRCHPLSMRSLSISTHRHR